MAAITFDTDSDSADDSLFTFPGFEAAAAVVEEALGGVKEDTMTCSTDTTYTLIWYDEQDPANPGWAGVPMTREMEHDYEVYARYLDGYTVREVWSCGLREARTEAGLLLRSDECLDAWVEQDGEELSR